MEVVIVVNLKEDATGVPKILLDERGRLVCANFMVEEIVVSLKVDVTNLRRRAVETRESLVCARDMAEVIAVKESVVSFMEFRLRGLHIITLMTHQVQEEECAARGLSI